MHEQLCALSLQRRSIIDLVRENGLTMYGNQTVQQLQAEYPDIVVIPCREASP